MLNKMEDIRRHFEEESREFDSLILKLIPGYAEMVSTIANVLPFGYDEAIRVADLGCGTGTVAKTVAVRYPESKLTLVDFSPRMLDLARVKLNDRLGTEYDTGDLMTWKSEEPFEAVVSSLALHHLPSDADKQACYRRIYSSLAPGGVFCNADVVLGGSDFLTEVYIGEWKSFMRRHFSAEEVESKYLERYRKEDSPAPLLSHLEWMREAGFREIDVVWKHYNTAVWTGRKGPSHDYAGVSDSPSIDMNGPVTLPIRPERADNRGVRR